MYTLDNGIFGPYAQLFDDQQGYLSDFPDIHTLDIGIFDLDGQIFDV